MTEPKHFGGMGGLKGGREYNPESLFEKDVMETLGEEMKHDVDLCIEMWSSLANVEWTHKDGHTAEYSFRAAGDMIAAIIGKGDYMDWYCQGPSGMVSERVEIALAKRGWTYQIFINTHV